MTKVECDTILADKTHPLYEELRHIYYTNYNKCRKHYDDLGYKGYTLHHINVTCSNYEEWKIDEIQPMTRSEHSRLHMTIYKQGLGSPESIKKAHDRLREKYASGELHAWNKGLTAKDNPSLASPRKGKTGDDFPFLCASKKGKSGGWNKNISKDDPRYNSLLHSDEQNKKQSEFMKHNNPMNNLEYRKKVGDSKRGKKKYTNGIETHIYFPGEEPDGYITLREFIELNRKEKDEN